MIEDSPCYTLGKPVVSAPVEHRNDADNLWGSGWHAERREQGCVLSFLRAAQGGGEMTIPISEAEFEQLRHEPEAFGAVVLRNGE